MSEHARLDHVRIRAFRPSIGKMIGAALLTIPAIAVPALLLADLLGLAACGLGRLAGAWAKAQTSSISG